MSEIKTIPMSTEEIQDLFLNPGKEYIIDLKNSKLKGEAFVTYVANMKLKCSLVKDSELSTEEKLDVFKNFLNYPYTVNCATLVETLCLFLLKQKGLNVDISDCWLSEEEMEKFNSDNKDTVETYLDFIDSMIIGVPSFNKAFKEEFLDKGIDNGEIELVEDPNAISVNVFGTFMIPNFLETFLSVPPREGFKLKYYKYQIERFSYNQKSLFDIFLGMGGSSILLSLTNALMSEVEEERKPLEEFMNSTGA